MDHKPVPKPRTPGASGYTEEEKRVLNHTSNINENIFVPFMDVDLKDRFVFSIPFTDKVCFRTLLPEKKLPILNQVEKKIKFCFLGWSFGIGTETKT